MRYPEDCRTGILPSGKVTVIIIRMTKANGDGSAPDYSAPQKICSLNPSFFHTSFRCWKMPVPLCILLANGTHKRMKSSLTTILRMLPFTWKQAVRRHAGRLLPWKDSPRKKPFTKMGKTLSLTVPAGIFKQKRKKRRIRIRLLPNGYLPCRQPENMRSMFHIRHYPIAWAMPNTSSFIMGVSRNLRSIKK